LEPHRAPSGGRVLASSPVDRLADQVGVSGVPAVLLGQVADQPAQPEDDQLPVSLRSWNPDLSLPGERFERYPAPARLATLA
jgi:hypothetical protein